MTEETTTDALKWVEALIEHYKERYSPEKALDGVLGEIKTCLIIAEWPDNDGTRFKEATEQLKQPSLFPIGVDDKQ